MINKIYQPTFQASRTSKYSVSPELLKDLVKKGKSNKEIAEITGCPAQFIRKELKKIGLNCAMVEKQSQTIKDVLELNRSGLYTISEIAHLTKLPKFKVTDIIKNFSKKIAIIPKTMPTANDEVLEQVLKKLNLTMDSVKQYLK